MKLITNFFLMVLVMTSFSQCSSAQKLQKEAPAKFGDVYCQNWAAGIQGGGSGTDIFISIETDLKENTQLDSVYFRGKASKLEFKPNNPFLYIGRFISSVNKKKDIIMSDKPNAEYGNEVPIIKTKIPFELKSNECVVSYKEDNKIKYFKIENIVEKQSLHYPSTPQKKQ